MTDVRRVWNEVLAAVQRHRRTTQILLASANVVSVSGGALHLTMPAAGMARRVVEPANADLLRAALKEVLGVDWMIRCDAADAPVAARRAAHRRRTRGRRRAASQAGLLPRTWCPRRTDDDIPDDYGETSTPLLPGLPSAIRRNWRSSC